VEQREQLTPETLERSRIRQCDFMATWLGTLLAKLGIRGKWLPLRWRFRPKFFLLFFCALLCWGQYQATLKPSTYDGTTTNMPAATSLARPACVVGLERQLDTSPRDRHR
jgi:hypothetical protein